MLGDPNDGLPKRQAYPEIRSVNTGAGRPIRPKQQPATRPSVGMKLMAPATRLPRRWQEGQRNVKTLHLELQQQGYPGAFRSLYRFVNRWLRAPGAAPISTGFPTHRVRSPSGKYLVVEGVRRLAQPAHSGLRNKFIINFSLACAGAPANPVV